jgi:hypothetical protein
VVPDNGFGDSRNYRLGSDNMGGEMMSCGDFPEIVCVDVVYCQFKSMHRCTSSGYCDFQRPRNTKNFYGEKPISVKHDKTTAQTE